jgi:sugar phosphate permease
LPILALLAAAAIVGALFVLRLRTAPEPLIPISILHDPIVRWAIIGNACGWGAIIGLNVLLPIYLQGVMGLSPTQAGLSLVMFLVAMNTSAGVAGQVLGRVRHYKRLPIALLSLAIAAVILLGWYADRVTPLAFELLVILIGAGFGPVPSLTAVAMQNVVSRHQFGISIGAMNFSRNLYATMLIAVFGAIVLASAQTRDAMDGAAAAAAQNAAHGFASVFFIAAASFAVALTAIVRLEEKPLRAGGEGDVE